MFQGHSRDAFIATNKADKNSCEAISTASYRVANFTLITYILQVNNKVTLLFVVSYLVFSNNVHYFNLIMNCMDTDVFRRYSVSGLVRVYVSYYWRRPLTL